MQQAHFQKIPGNPWHQEWGHCLSLAVEPLCWELVNHCWKWASEQDTQHRNLCNDDEKAIANAQFFCSSFPLHFQSNCKAIPVKKRADQRCWRTTDTNSMAGTFRAAYPAPPVISPGKMSPASTQLCSPSQETAGAEGCHPSTLCRNISAGAGLFGLAGLSFSQSSLMVTWLRLSFHTSSRTLKAPPKSACSAPWGKNFKKLLKCEQTTKSQAYIRSVVAFYSYLPVQGSCPHLFTLLKALSPQVFTLAFALAYLLAKLHRRLRSCWRFLLFLFSFPFFIWINLTQLFCRFAALCKPCGSMRFRETFHMLLSHLGLREFQLLPFLFLKVAF